MKKLRLKKEERRIEGECSATKCYNPSEIVLKTEKISAEFCDKHWEQYCEEN
jgi:hypothetical protein